MTRNLRTILIGCFGSYGEMLPFQRLSRALAGIGIRPVVLAPKTMESNFLAAGAEFIPLNDPDDILIKADPLLFTNQGGWSRLFSQYLEPTVRGIYNQSLEVISLVKPDIVWASWIVPGLHLAAFHKQVPVQRVCLYPHAAQPVAQPILFNHDRYFRIHDIELSTPELDLICDRVSLNCGGREFMFPNLDHSVPRILLYPKAFGPSPLGHAKYLKDELQSPSSELPEYLKGFLDEGSAPVLVSIGSVAGFGNIQLLEKLGRAVVAAGFRVFISTGLMNTPIRREERCLIGGGVPLRSVYPHVLGVIHHSGLGNSQETLSHGLPAIAVPLAFDQYELANRLQKLGVALKVDRDATLPELRDLCGYAFSLTSPIRNAAKEWEGDKLYAESLSLSELISSMDLTC